MSDDFLLPSDDDLIAAAVQHEQERHQLSLWEATTGFPFPRDGQPVVWVKWSTDPYRMECEAATQEYVYETLSQQPDLSELIRVPQIYRVIDVDSDDRNIPLALIVMEYVPGRTVRQWLEGETSEERKRLLWDRVLHALSTFLTFQPPSPDTPPGPAGGGRIAHLLFGEYYESGDAPRDFDSVQDLQTHINQTIVSGRRNGRVNFRREDLKLCFCDPHQSNFILADAEGVGPIYVIDFEHCMWLPISFLRWNLVHHPRGGIFTYLRRNLERLQQLPVSETNDRALDQFSSLQGTWGRRTRYVT